MTTRAREVKEERSARSFGRHACKPLRKPRKMFSRRRR